MLEILCVQGFQGIVQLEAARASNPSLCVPVILIPATISNNVPGTDMCIGCDTGLNAVCEVSQFAMHL